MLAAVQFKRHMTGSYVLGIIISKFGHWYELGLIILLKIDKVLELHFYYTILLFNLTVNLKVKLNKKLTLNV